MTHGHGQQGEVWLGEWGGDRAGESNGEKLGQTLIEQLLKKSKLVNFCVAILILKIEENI